jgi:16S rRNA (cytosine1402-N4)-methyltransferase
LKRLNTKGKLFAFDRDADAIKNTITDKRFMLIRHNFRYMKKFLAYYDALPVNGIIADLGISSHQINVADRGFSTRFEAELDMRMSRETELTASMVINEYVEEDLVRIFSAYGEVRNSRTLAKTIVEARKKKSIHTISEFKSAIERCADRGMENQYLAKVFQALRIEVNDELGSLKDMLMQCPDMIIKGGRLSIISYHSLEDRLVKNFIGKGKFEGDLEKDIFGNAADVPFKAVNKKPTLATEEEVKRNPRARSAKLRIAERI